MIGHAVFSLFLHLSDIEKYSSQCGVRLFTQSTIYTHKGMIRRCLRKSLLSRRV